MRVLLAVIGSLSLALGFRWLQLFILTDYRAHLRHVLIPLGIVATVLGLSLLLLSVRAFARRTISKR
jgi:hypothetical protein